MFFEMKLFCSRFWYIYCKCSNIETFSKFSNCVENNKMGLKYRPIYQDYVSRVISYLVTHIGSQIISRFVHDCYFLAR